MDYIKNLLKSLLLTVGLLLFLILILTLFYHFDIISNNIYSIFKLIIPLLSLFVGAFTLGKKVTKRGWLEGLKLGGILIFLFFTISSIFFEGGFTLKLVLYDIILLIVSILGGMIGINKKQDL